MTNPTCKWMPLALVLALAACNQNSQVTAADGGCGTLAEGEICVKIGSAGPLTGGIAESGLDTQRGVQLAINDINAQGNLMIGGKKVKLAMVSEDDAADPKQGPVVAQKLVDSAVVGVVGHFNSGVSIPANKVYAEAGMVQIAPASTNPDYTLKSVKTHSGLVSAYRTILTDSRQAPVLAQYMLKNGGKTVAVLDDATQYGKGIADEVAKTLQQAGATVVHRDSATDKTTDFKAILTTIKAKNPDYVFWGGMDDTAAILAKQLKELGLKSQLVSDDGVCSERFVQLAGAAAEGTVCSQPVPLEKMPKGTQFKAEYEKTFPGKQALTFSPFAYDATFAIVEAMKLADSVKREDITQAMPKVNFEGVIGNIAFDENGDMKKGASSLFKVQEGKLVNFEVINF